jgi:8-oxo-dGTP diphosphatase
LVEVAAALIRRGRTFLICQRPAHKARGLLWEFVGGKIEPGETPARALVRECREELGVEVEPGEVFFETVHEYPDLTVRLILFSARIAAGEPRLLEHADLRWIEPEEADAFAFCPADEPVLDRIRAEAADGRWDRRDRKKELFAEQKQLLDTFLAHGAISRAQYEKSLGCLCEKMGFSRDGT